MNDVVLQELKRVVQQAVQPVRATIARKRRMREELLAHLIAIFGEEAERLGDEQAAMERAKQRFGNPGELTPELQQAVPQWDRCRSFLENLGYRPNESAWHLAAKHFLVMLLIYSLAVSTWLLVVVQLPDQGAVEIQRLLAFVLVGAVLLAALFNVILSIVLAPLLSKIGPGLAAKRSGRILLASLCGLAVVCGFVLPAFAGVTVVLALMARQTVVEWRYQADWV